MLKVLRDEYKGDVHVSTGMTTKKEIEDVVKFFEVIASHMPAIRCSSNLRFVSGAQETGAAKDRLVIYNCTSGYPVPFKDICMLEISRLYAEYGDRVKEIAFSGHHLGIAVDIAAYALGATWIERHFTKDRTWKGTDHAASLEPAGLGKLCRDLVATYESLSMKATDVLDIESEQRDKLKYRKGVKLNAVDE